MSKDANYKKLIGSPRWRALRNAYMSEHPQCEECLSRGIYRAANCVHHIIPCETARSVKEMELLMFSASNLRALCLQCHSELHASERSHSKEAHEARQADALQRFKAKHPAPTNSYFTQPRGAFYEKGGIDSQIHLPSRELRD